MDRDHILRDIQAFDEELSREHLANSLGYKDDLVITPIYQKYSHLFTLDNIKLLKILLDASKLPSTKKKNLLLYDYLVSGHISNELKHIAEKATAYESKTMVKIGGKKVPFRSAGILILSEPNRKKRQAMVDAMEPHKRILTKYDEEALEKEYALLKKLTGKNYTDYVEWIKGLEYDKLANDLRQFLIDTHEVYTEHLHRIMTELKVPVHDIRKHDLGYYLRAHTFDRYFPKSKLISMLQKTVGGMGIQLSKQKNVHIDAEDRPKKVPRAFCCPLLIPQEIYLVLKPHGGQEDYQTILHEAGHSEHYAHTRADLPYEFKHMGAHNVTETYSFLFEYLVLNPEWRKTFTLLKDKKDKDYAHFLWFQKLSFLRRYAAKFLYELKFHRKDLRVLNDTYQPTRKKYDSSAKMYAAILGQATGVKYNVTDYLLDMDSAFYSADYLLAWMFEVQVRKKLEEKFGIAWFKNKKSGTFLKDMWQFGSDGLTQQELAKRIGYNAVDKTYLIQEALTGPQ